MEKIFEDKEFHGAVKFFDDLDLRGAATVNLVNKENPNKGLHNIDRYGANWWGCYNGTNNINDDFVNGSVSPLAAFFGLIVDLTTPVTFSGQWQGIRGSIIAGSTDSMTSADFAVIQSIFLTATDNTATMANVTGIESAGKSSTGAVGTVTNFKGFFSTNFAWGTTTFTNYYAFYSDFPMTAKITNAWHFYGVGDFPSYFGGKILQLEKDITAATPPTQAEMVSELGAASAHVDASLMVKVTDGSHFRVFSDGTSWFYSAYTVGA